MNAIPTTEERELRASIGRREKQLDHALEDLVVAAEARASLGHYVARYPWQFLLGALIVGVWLGRRR
jgi:hypothetical protein